MTNSSRALVLIAHNIRSAYNVGALLRTADSLGISKVYLTGYTPTSDHTRVKKTALGAEDTVETVVETDVVQVIERLRSEGYRIVGLELDERAVSIETYQAPEVCALLIGNEREGIAPSLRTRCDDLVMIEQRGMKESMNVAVATGIAVYQLLRRSA